MINLSKYRKLSIISVIIFSITWLSALAAFWNTILTTQAKNEGWVIVFMSMVLISGIILFYFAFVSADQTKINQMVSKAYESGKSEIIREIERKKQTEHDQQAKDEDIQKTLDAVLSGIGAARSENGLCSKLLTGLAREMEFVQGVMYLRKDSVFFPAGEYALTDRKPQPFSDGETLASQAVSSKSITIIHDIPENYFTISSGLGSSSPGHLVLAPVVHNNEVIGVLELASFNKPDASTEKILEKILEEAAPKIKKFIDKS